MVRHWPSQRDEGLSNIHHVANNQHQWSKLQCSTVSVFFLSVWGYILSFVSNDIHTDMITFIEAYQGLHDGRFGFIFCVHIYAKIAVRTILVTCFRLFMVLLRSNSVFLCVLALKRWPCFALTAVQAIPWFYPFSSHGTRWRHHREGTRSRHIEMISSVATFLDASKDMPARRWHLCYHL